MSTLLNQVNLRVSGVANVSAAADQAMDLTELGLGAGRDHNARTGTVRHERARSTPCCVDPRRASRRQHDLVLDDRKRLARERRLVDLKLVDRQQPQVGGNLVTRLDEHQVAGHELLRRHGSARDRRGAPSRSCRTIARNASSAASALDSCTKPTTAFNTTTPRMTRRVHPLAENERHRPGCEQNVDERMVELPREPNQRSGGL